MGFNLLHQFAGRNIFLDDLGIFFAKYVPYLLVIGFLYLVLHGAGKWNDWRGKFLFFAEGAIAVMLSRGLITEIIRFFYYNPRPFDVYGFAPLIAESGASFPSGHATFYFALAIIVWFTNRKWGTWYLVLAALNGIARIYVGVHWPLDVLSGALIGIVSALVVHQLMKNSREKLAHSHAPATAHQ